MARFIVFEGGEATGKSTQARRLAARLGAVHTHEPGGTDVGAALRALLLDLRTTGLDPRAEALLMAADRAQHVAEVVRPALAAGRHVVCDRYIGSTSPTRATAGACRWTSCAACRPGPPATCGRTWSCCSTSPGGGPPPVDGRRDRWRRRGGVPRAGAARLPGAGGGRPQRWVTIDGTPPPDEVEAAVWEAVATRLPDLARRRAGAGHGAGGGRTGTAGERD